MDIKESLRRFGLSETEAVIYLALIKIGESTAVQLAKETDVHRRTIYDNLNILLKKGLVSFKIKNKVKYFEATNPNSLKVFIEEKNKILNDILPALNSFYKQEQKTPRINVYVGLDSAKAIIEEAFKTKKPLYWMGGGYFFSKALKYSKDFVEGKIKKMNIKIIQADREDVKGLIKLVKKSNMRIIPKEFISRVGYLVFGNKVAIGIIQEKEITTILIEDLECAKAFKNYFNLIWKIGGSIKSK